MPISWTWDERNSTPFLLSQTKGKTLCNFLSLEISLKIIDKIYLHPAFFVAEKYKKKIDHY